MAYYNEKHGIYFIHIAKTGGKSVADFLLNLPGDNSFIPMSKGHLEANKIEEYLNQKFPNKTWTGITVLRNPFNRYISAYDFNFYTAKSIMENRYSKTQPINDKIMWLKFGVLTYDSLLNEWVNYQNKKSSTNFLKVLPFTISTLRKQSEYVLPSTIKFKLESINSLKIYFQNIIGEELLDIKIVNETKLHYAKLAKLNEDTLNLIKKYYNDDFTLGNYSKEIINN